MGMQKAVVAIIGGVIVIANELFGANIGLDEPTVSAAVNSVVAVLTALGVWAVPNKA